MSKIRRHRRFTEDYKVIVEERKSTADYYKDMIDAARAKLHADPPKSHDQLIELYVALIAQHLDVISSQLEGLQYIGLASLFRQQDADEEVASLLFKWKLRSPIVRGDEADNK